MNLESKFRVQKLEHVETGKTANQISIDDLYGSDDEDDYVIGALAIVDQAISKVRMAITASVKKRHIESDDAVQHFTALLPELFMYRDIGDGFGTIVIALFHSLKNSAQSPLDSKQLREILGSLILIRREPFLTHDACLFQIDKLESVLLNPIPIAVDIITSALEGDEGKAAGSE